MQKKHFLLTKVFHKKIQFKTLFSNILLLTYLYSKTRTKKNSKTKFMNIAIVIGVSEYKNENDLPGCKNDCDIIYNILEKTDKFDDMLKINDNQNSQIVKEKLTSFIDKFDGQKIDEIFFYYSGHGEFYNEEFYYLMSDYDFNKRKQSSIENTELDNYFKSLNPELVIKVIDACQSGKNYIKNVENVEKYFKEKNSQFKNCYFLNSSLYNQSSYIYGNISEFTFSFINSIKNHTVSEIRYKDIIDFIADDFEKNTEQTPFFVVQANYREKFCTLHPQLVTYLQTIEKNATSSVPSKELDHSLISKIKKEADYFISKESLIEILEKLKETFNGFSLTQELHEIFHLSIDFFENYESIAKKKIIGDWLLENPKQFYATPKYDRIIDKESTPSKYLSPLYSSAIRTIFEDPNVKYKSVLTGFDLDVEVPYKTICLTFTSKFPNVASYTCRIVFLVSNKQLRFFYFITNYEEKNWDDKYLNSEFDWITAQYDFKDVSKIYDGAKLIYDATITKIKKDIEERYK